MKYLALIALLFLNGCALLPKESILGPKDFEVLLGMELCAPNGLVKILTPRTDDRSPTYQCSDGNVVSTSPKHPMYPVLTHLEADVLLGDQACKHDGGLKEIIIPSGMEKPGLWRVKYGCKNEHITIIMQWNISESRKTGLVDYPKGIGDVSVSVEDLGRE